MIVFDIASFDMQNKEFEARYLSLIVRTTGCPTHMIVSFYIYIKLYILFLILLMSKDSTRVNSA
jgi:hypothetical protein